MIKILLKNKLSAMLFSMLGKNKKSENGKGKGRTALFIVLYIYLAVCMLFLSVTMSLSLAVTLIPMGASWLYFSIFTIASLSILFILSIFETKSELFECRDNDLLLSMPIPERALVIARISTVLLINYAVEAFVMLPAIIFYAVISHDFIGVIGALIVSLAVPLLATSLASGIGAVLAAVSRRMRKNSFITLALALAFFALYFVAIGALTSGMDEIFTGVDVENLKANFKILVFIGNASLLKPLPLIGVVLLSLAVSALVYFIIAKNYFKIATDNRGAKKAKYRERRYENRGAVTALTGKELRKFFSSTTYMLNSALGIIFLVVLSVLAIVERGALETTVSGMFPGVSAGAILPPLMIAGIVLCSCTNMISASALSLEGKNLWVIKSLPVSDTAVLLSKSLPQIIVCTPPTLLAAVLMFIASGAAPIYIPFFILTPFVANVLFAFLGLIFNIVSPRFDFDNEAQPIKQSLPTFLTMITQMLLSVAIVIVNAVFAFVNLGVIGAAVTLLALLLLSAVAAVILFVPCKKKYSSITV